MIFQLYGSKLLKIAPERMSHTNANADFFVNVPFIGRDIVASGYGKWQNRSANTGN